MEVMFITNNPKIALIAEKAGVDRIWIDLEKLGKEERQKGMNTVKSNHSISDVSLIKPLLTKSKLQVRVNPWNPNSEAEINQVIDSGAEYIMLPMWKSCEEVNNFIKTVNYRCKTILLLETREAVEILDDVLKIDGIDEIHIGLNDLHLSYHNKFMFEPFANGIVENICNKIKGAEIQYGIGGVSHLGDGTIPAEMILKEHFRLGSTRVILSRGFCNIKQDDLHVIENEFVENMNSFRKFEDNLCKISEDEIKANHKKFVNLINNIVQNEKC